jgi:hypothetical protein
MRRATIPFAEPMGDGGEFGAAMALSYGMGWPGSLAFNRGRVTVSECKKSMS